MLARRIWDFTLFWWLCVFACLIPSVFAHVLFLSVLHPHPPPLHIRVYKQIIKCKKKKEEIKEKRTLFCGMKRRKEREGVYRWIKMAMNGDDWCLIRLWLPSLAGSGG
jgi:hypothetical protein